jgi:CheY-like chemotaxis protein
VLILDDELLIRTLYAQQLERVGGVAYRAESLDLAVRLLKADSEIGVAILDDEMPGVELEEIVRTLEQIRPGIRLVGNGAGDPRARFSAVGVERTLSKPWRVSELIDVLRD